MEQATVRQRKKTKTGTEDEKPSEDLPDHVRPSSTSHISDTENSPHSSTSDEFYPEDQDAELTEESLSVFQGFLAKINVVLGLTVMDVEKEISFRTESGLYYSYYKQVVMASSFSKGVHELRYDNVTEHPSTVNILARMNVYQELLVGGLYRCITSLGIKYQPIYLYIDTVFALQGVMLCALYLMTWLLSGTWIASVLMAGFYIFNREDITRVNMTIPLRENWSLPFFYLQMTTITYYLTPDLSRRKQMASSVVLFLTTFLFAITWQFNQFVLLLQALALFACQLLDLLPKHKIITLYSVQALSMLLVCILQFGNPMILSGLLLSFIPAALVVLSLQRKFPVCGNGLISSIARVLGYITLALVLLKLFNSSLKIILKQEADEHIYKFILAKIGWSNPRDFDVHLYLCNGAFQFLTPDTFIRLSMKLVFPIYLTFHTALLATVVMDVWQRWSEAPYFEASSMDSELASFEDQPQFSYHSIQCVLYGMLAITTLRMKYFWTPYMCVLASTGLADHKLWMWLLQLTRYNTYRALSITRNTALVLVLAALLYIAVPPAVKELEELREFYDPDTVELMEWIKSSTPAAAAFSGSMQLLAGVKLCTGRHITNHPHYEDKALRLRTRELYQFYSRSTAEDVYTVLKKYQAGYIILEDSICLSPREGCRLTDILDLSSGIRPDGEHPGTDLADFVVSNIPRFCKEITNATPEYYKYFKLVFENKTFRIFMVL